MDIEPVSNNNILFAPDLNLIAKERMPLDQQDIEPSINKSSMINYSKIVCCICSASIEANALGICEACQRKSIDISAGVTKEGVIHYCKGCDRYLRPPWVKCPLESNEMMTLCLSKIKGLNKAKIIDSSFVWTEPHSKQIKVKLTIQKEFEKNVISTSFIVNFKVEWTQCDDCRKLFTPHVWNSSVQVRQKVNHKRTFLLLEQLILKHRAHTKAINIKEHPLGVDFYFANRSQANTFVAFVDSVLPTKSKPSRQLISHDQKSNIFHYKYTFSVEIAPVCKDDLIVLTQDEYKRLGGIGPLLLCYKQNWKLSFVDPMSFDTIDLDGNTYWRYELKSYIDRECLSEFLIISCEEEVDYAERYRNQRNERERNRQMDIDTDTKQDTSAANTTIAKEKPSEFKIVNVKCIRNNSKKSEKNKDDEVLEVRTCLGKKMHPGDIFYGYDMTQINLSEDLIQILDKKKERVPDVIFVKKKYNNYKRIFKLKRMDIEMEDDGNEKPKKREKMNKKEKDYEDFLEEVGQNKDIRDRIDIYKDDKAILELTKGMGKLDLNQEEEDSDVDIKLEDMLDNLTLEDKPPKYSKNKFKEDDDDDWEELEDEVEKIQKSKNTKGGKKNKKTKQIGKRERTGDRLEEDNSDN